MRSLPTWDAYGSEGWGFESLRARHTDMQFRGGFRLPGAASVASRQDPDFYRIFYRITGVV